VEAMTFSMVVTATVRLGAGTGTVLADDAAGSMVRVVVDTDLHLPGMFELTFLDNGTDALRTAGLVMGATVQVFSLAPGETTDTCLIQGEVTCLEGRFENLHRKIVVRGYDLTHRLQRVRRTRTFLNMTDSDIASRIFREAGLTNTQVDQSSTTHDHIGQCDQTDWDFLGQRAAEIGYELTTDAGVLHFRAASTVSAGTPVPLEFPINLWAFRPRLTAGNLSPEVEVRVWDPLQNKVLTHVAAASAGSVSLTGQQPQTLGTTFTSGAGPATPPAAKGSAVGDLGPAPSTSAHVVHNLPVAMGSGIDPAGQQAAKAVAEHVGSTFAEADGEAAGTPHIRAGAPLAVTGVSDPFSGSWLVTSAQHVFDTAETGYVTRFVASGRQTRSLLGLASGGGAARPARAALTGVYCGVVTNNNDPNKKGRVKITLPWLSPDYESDWAPAVQFAAGRASGAMFLPEVGDEVLVGFEFADPRRPYVLGGIVNNNTAYGLGGDAIKATGMAGQVVRRGFVSAAGNRLMFHDEVPPGDGGSPPTASDLVLGTGDGSLALSIDQTAGTVTLSCKPAPPGSNAAGGQITIQCGDAGVVNIATGAGGSVTIDGGDSLSLKAKSSIQIESNGQVAIKGTRITLN
ncbi:MAG TPA: phage baseplate assembly protein V, partial [Pseudonocardiaceae bacterium]|nr:phage baseplate assembly protein V [Pseudonocardiaceae bacterium]